MPGFGDNFILVIPLEDDQLHTEEHPFCSHDTCPCHEDLTLHAPVAEAVTNGLLTPAEATRLVAGWMLWQQERATWSATPEQEVLP